MALVLSLELPHPCGVVVHPRIFSKVILGVLVADKKAIVLLAVAAFAFLERLFGEKEAEAPPSVPPSE